MWGKKMTSLEAQIYLCEVCKNSNCTHIGTKYKHSFCVDYIKDATKENNKLNLQSKYKNMR